VVEKFVDRINEHDVEGLAALMSPDHVFTDSLGNNFPRPDIETGWRQYFATVPDYWVRVDRKVPDGSALILIGTAGGTYVPNGGAMKAENKWETPAVWRAVIQNGKVLEWRIFADNEPIRARMRSAGNQLESALREHGGNQPAALITESVIGGTTDRESERSATNTGEGERSAAEVAREQVDWKRIEEEVKKSLDGLTLQEAEERYNYLSSRPISELTDVEYKERLALAEKISEKPSSKKPAKH